VKLVSGFRHTPGNHCGSTSMRDLLSHAGLNMSEAMCFGLGSGLGFFYFRNVPEMGITHFFHGRPATLERKLCQHLALDFVEGKHDDSDEAWRVAREFLDADVPMMLNVELSQLPYYNTRTPFPGHRVVLAGYDDTRRVTFIADNAYAQLQEVDYAALRTARVAPIPSSLFPLCNDWLVVKSVKHHTPLVDAIPAALRENVNEMLVEHEPQRGIAGMKTLADDFVRWGDAPDWEWCARFAYQIIERRGTGGGAFRKMYATYLREAEAIVPALQSARLADEMETIAEAWTNLASILKRTSNEKDRRGLEQAGISIHRVAKLEEKFWERMKKIVGA
jgi:hypothetical protein